MSPKKTAPLARRRDQRAEQIRAEYAEVAGHRERLGLEAIGERVHGDTRGLDEAHIEELSESIEVLGLITPLTIDTRGALLAGGHRRAALSSLQARNPARFEELFPDGVPVYRLALDSAEDAIEALQLEVEENTQRLNYSAEEIREAARRLEAAGYERLKGRPQAGQRSLKRALQKVFRLSDRRIQQILNEPSSGAQQSAELTLSEGEAFERGLKRLSKQLKKATSVVHDEGALTAQQRLVFRQAQDLLSAISRLK